MGHVEAPGQKSNVVYMKLSGRFETQCFGWGWLDVSHSSIWGRPGADVPPSVGGVRSCSQLSSAWVRWAAGDARRPHCGGVQASLRGPPAACADTASSSVAVWGQDVGCTAGHSSGRATGGWLAAEKGGCWRSHGGGGRSFAGSPRGGRVPARTRQWRSRKCYFLVRVGGCKSPGWWGMENGILRADGASLVPRPDLV